MCGEGFGECVGKDLMSVWEGLDECVGGTR